MGKSNTDPNIHMRGEPNIRFGQSRLKHSSQVDHVDMVNLLGRHKNIYPVVHHHWLPPPHRWLTSCPTTHNKNIKTYIKTCGSSITALVHCRRGIIFSWHYVAPAIGWKMWCNRFLTNPFLFSPEGSSLVSRSASLLWVLTCDVLHSSLAAPSLTK